MNTHLEMFKMLSEIVQEAKHKIKSPLAII